MQNEMFSNREEKKRRDSDNEDGSFMVQIPKSISKTNIFEPDDDYMNEVRTKSKSQKQRLENNL